jgi:dipeptidyl aminopeptidase/acylaminoacyl peptidase
MNLFLQFTSRAWIALAVALLATATPFAQTANPSEPLSVEAFMRRPNISGVRLSPDGKAILGVRVQNKRRNVVVVDLATKKTLIITNYKDADVQNAFWLTPERIGYALVDLQRGMGDQERGAGFFAVDRNGENYRQLVEQGTEAERGTLLPAGSSMLSMIFVDDKVTDEALFVVGSKEAQGRFSSSVYRLNIRTGRSTLASLGAPNNSQSWAAAPNGELRAAATSLDDESGALFYRKPGEASWREIARWNRLDEQNAIAPVAIDSDGSLLVSAYFGKDTTGIYRYDDKAGAFDKTPLFFVDGQDIGRGDLVRSVRTGKLFGLQYQLDKPKVLWLDADLEALQAGIDKALPNTVNSISGQLDRKDGKILVTSFSDRDPGRFYTYDRADKSLLQVAVGSPWIDPAKMADSKFYRYPARDGLSIPAILTLPPGSSGKNLPLVIQHYGGPWARAINYGFDANVQFLASRGYAVLMPAPRASTGWGYKHYAAGHKQWGLAMQDDVEDGVRALIKEGVVDPKRICITGASYGGYMTMMGLAKTPDLYRCGINWIGVTDPSFMFSVTWTDFARAGGSDAGLRMRLGDPDKDAAQFAQTSPLKRAKEIKQPVLMAYGGLDQRVPIVNGERMLSALRGHNPNVEWVVYNDEAHGWLKQENVIDFWTRVEKFLATNLK